MTDTTEIQHSVAKYRSWVQILNNFAYDLFTALCIFGLHFLPSCRCPAERWRQGCPLPASSVVKRPPHGAQWSTAADDWSPAKHNNTLNWKQQTATTTNTQLTTGLLQTNNSTSNWMQQQINTQPATDLQNTTAHQTECSKTKTNKNTKLATGLLQNTTVHHTECSKTNNTQLMVSLLQNTTAQNTECSKTTTQLTSSLLQNTEYSKTNNKHTHIQKNTPRHCQQNSKSSKSGMPPWVLIDFLYCVFGYHASPVILN